MPSFIAIQEEVRAMLDIDESELSDEQRETLLNFISKLAQYMPWTERD